MVGTAERPVGGPYASQTGRVALRLNLVNTFLTDRQRRLEANELMPRSEYYKSTGNMVDRTEVFPTARLTRKNGIVLELSASLTAGCLSTR